MRRFSQFLTGNAMANGRSSWIRKRLDRVGIDAPIDLPAFLKQAGLPFESPDDSTVVMRDPDRITTEFASAGWYDIGERDFSGYPSATGREVFSPIQIQSVVLNVADPEASTRFYQRFLGPPIRGANNRTWFRIDDFAISASSESRTPRLERSTSSASSHNLST